MTMPPDARSRRLILVVDDDLIMLGLLSKFLAADYEVRIASSAPMALGMIADGGREPDLAIFDISMPGMSGLELAGHVRAHTTIPFLFLTASESGDAVEIAAAHGALGYLLKPLDLAQLGAAMVAALARGDEIRGLRDSETRLSQALRQGRDTGMAVGVLMERYKTDRESAFRVMRDHARSQRRKLADVAAEVLASAESFDTLATRFGAGPRP